MTIEEVLAFEEMQIFGRKSINIEPRALAIPIIAFTNADGGTIAIGVSDKTKTIEGTIEFYMSVKDDLYTYNHIIYDRYRNEKILYAEIKDDERFAFW